MARWVAGASPGLDLHRLDCREDFAALLGAAPGNDDALERGLGERHPDGRFKFDGYCWVDRARVSFAVDYAYALESGGRKRPNWRERLVCPKCGLNNRQRAMIHVACVGLGLHRETKLYLTEQVSAVYRCLAARFPRIVGSEFLGPTASPGSIDRRGVRHEDLTRLTFADGSVDAVLTFDVLEHVPDYRAALAECFRVLAPGGVLLLTAPFLADSDATRVRATLGADGSLRHHLPPQFHGDPVQPDRGVLCYQEFGWDLLERLRESGFIEAAAIALRSPALGYLGGWQIAFAAWKSPAERGATTTSFDRETLLQSPQAGEYAWHAITVDDRIPRVSTEHFDAIDRALGVHGMPKRGVRLLEVGAYRHFTGYVAAQRWSAEATLTDIASRSLQAGREAAHAAGFAAKPRLVVADFHDLPFGDCQYDVAFVASTIHHTRSPERVLREMFRVLRPGGLLLLENEPCSRLACFHRFASNRPERFTALERFLEEQGLLRTVASPFPGSRAEEVFGMVENDRIPVQLFHDELSAGGEILEWRLQTDGLIGEFEKSLLALPGSGETLARSVREHLLAAIEPARNRLGETDRLLHRRLPDAEEVGTLAERIASALASMPRRGSAREMAIAALFGAALKAVARKAGPREARTSIGPRFRRAMRCVDGVWEEADAQHGIAALLGAPRLPDVYRPENTAALAPFFPTSEWRRELEQHGGASLLNLDADASVHLDTAEEGVFLLRFFAAVAEDLPFAVSLLADDHPLERQVMALSESRLMRGWVPAGTRRVRIALRTLDGRPVHRAGAIRVGVAQFLPAPGVRGIQARES